MPGDRSWTPGTLWKTATTSPCTCAQQQTAQLAAGPRHQPEKQGRTTFGARAGERQCLSLSKFSRLLLLEAIHEAIHEPTRQQPGNCFSTAMPIGRVVGLILAVRSMKRA